MAVEEVVIKVRPDAGNDAAVKHTVDNINKITEAEKKAAEQFKKDNDEYIEAAKKRQRIIAEEEANIKSLEAAKKKAHSPEDIRLYDDAIKQSKENISTLKGVTEKLGKENDKLTGALKKVGAAILAAFAVSKIKDFAKDVIMSTQATGDAFNMMMGGMKESTNYFFRAIATGDFTNLIDGLKAAYEEGERYVEALDLIGDMTRAMSVKTAQIDNEIAILEEKARDRTKYTVQERKQALKELLIKEEEKLVEIKKIRTRELDNELVHASQITGLSFGALEEIFKNQEAHEKMMQAAKLDAQLKSEATELQWNDRAQAYISTFNSEKYKKLLAAQNSEFRSAKYFNDEMSKLTDENRKNLTKAYIQNIQAETQSQHAKTRFVRLKVQQENQLRAEQTEAEKKAEDERKAAFSRWVDMENRRIQLITNENEKLIEIEKLRYAIDKNAVEEAYKGKIEINKALEYTEKIHQLNILKIKQASADDIADLENEIYLLTLSDTEKQVAAVIDKYSKLKVEALKHKLSIIEINQAEKDEIEKILKAAAEKELKEADKLDKSLEKQEKQLFEQHMKFIENISDATFDRIEANHDRIMQMLDDEIKKQEQNIDTQQSLAERGLANTLSFEQTKMQELEKQRIEAQKREEKRLKAQEAAKLVLAFIDAYQSNLEAKQTPPIALTNAFKQTMLAKMLGTAIGGMFEEGGIVGVDGKGMIHGNRHSNGGVLIEAEGGEGILSRKEVAKMGVANFYNLKQMLKKPASDVAVIGGNSAVLQGISELNQTIKQIPSIHYGIDNLGQIVKTEIKAGMRNITTFKRRVN